MPAILTVEKAQELYDEITDAGAAWVASARHTLNADPVDRNAFSRVEDQKRARFWSVVADIVHLARETSGD